MKPPNTIQLDVWQGDWGLASVNIECLQILAYARFNEIPIKVNTKSNLLRTPHGQLPVLRVNFTTLDKTNDMIQFFKELNYNSDSTLSCNEYMQVMAYEIMLKEMLYPALQFIWWLDQSIVNDLTRPWFFKTVSFPLNFYYFNKSVKEAKNLMETLYPMEDDTNVIQNKVYSEALKCLTLLSNRLGESEYFFGQEVTTLDAIVYSYLALLLKIPLPNSALQNHLKACTNLVNFVSRISKKYFSNELEEYEKRKAKENAEKLKKDSLSEFPNKRRDQIIAGFVALTVMIGHALLTGLLKVPMKKNTLQDQSGRYVIQDEDADE